MLSDLFALCARNLHSTMIALFGPVILASHRIDPIFKVNVWNTFDGNAEVWNTFDGNGGVTGP